VCEKTPRLIREINPEIPKWLVEVIAKLQAKAPEVRFESAAEVADVLSERLAELQHPIAAIPSKPKKGPKPATARHWWMAAAGLLLLVIGLGLTEAAGVTRVSQWVATVLRISTPQGTLVVEVNDPDVKVAVEGDGGLVITGAGPQEVRLRPGVYRLRTSTQNGQRVQLTDAAGKPLPSELIRITRGDKQVVKVSVESASAPQIPASRDGKAFVVLSARGVPESKFDTLAAAVLGASSGDTIEIRGNGPFVSRPVGFPRSLIIRAGKGFRPVIQLEKNADGVNLFTAEASLVLEGLELQRPAHCGAGHLLAISDRVTPTLRVANCRFVLQAVGECIWHRASISALRNCEFLAAPGRHVASVDWNSASHGQLVIENCILTAPLGISYGNLPSTETDLQDVSVRFHRNTVIGAPGHGFALGFAGIPELAGEDAPIRLECTDSLFHSDAALLRFRRYMRAEQATTAAAPEELLHELIRWREQRNVYPRDVDLVQFSIESMPPDAIASREIELTRFGNLSDWSRFWGMAETNSLQGRIQFQGADVLAKANIDPALLSPHDFRLLQSSPGYQSGPKGEDLGADVELVGPGAAYERWKRTPDYQKWLNESGQLQDNVKVESQPFVVLGRNDIEERGFPTLAEAVLASKADDLIEIRANGPFRTEQIAIRHPLTIHAGGGFTPMIARNLDTAPLAPGESLLENYSRLVLEGIDFQISSEQSRPFNDALLELRPHSQTYISNCQFSASQRAWGIRVAQDSDLEIRNSHCLHACISFVPNSQIVADNNVLVSHVGALSFGVSPAPPASLRMTRNTVLASNVISIWDDLEDEDPVPAAPQLHCDSSDNDFTGAINVILCILTPRQQGKPGISRPDAALALIQKHVTWREARNAYDPRFPLLNLGLAGSTAYVPGKTSLAEWNEFWSIGESGTLQGSAAERIAARRARGISIQPFAPEEFRLRPGDVGYRAGPEGRDLGADVELVGPGNAYSRWKKTPEYERWRLRVSHAAPKSDVMKQAAQLEPEAFVVLGGLDFQERRFNTLTEAILNATDGEVIEIRGNGPFVCQNRHLGPRGSLVIRAGEGFRPLLVVDPESPYPRLLYTTHRLVLEGLEIHRVGGAEPRHAGNVVTAHTSPLYVANCRFVVDSVGGVGAVQASYCPESIVRNSQFICGDGQFPAHYTRPAGSIRVENNLVALAGNLNVPALAVIDNVNEGSSLLLARNTFLAARPLLGIGWPKAADAGADSPGRPFPVEALDNVFDASVVLRLDVNEPLATNDHDAMLRRHVSWDGRQNFYGSLAKPIELRRRNEVGQPQAGQSVAAWEQFWKPEGAEFLEGAVPFEADLIGVTSTMAPEDFRVRSDSPGHRAGGTDLGADVDLVGPGEAYERWKKTPEYTKWLEETGQKKR
jgi:hypothetical protein